MKLVFLPSNLNIEQLLTDNPPLFPYQIECFEYIIGLIVNRMGYRNDNVDDQSDYAPINARLLHVFIIGRFYLYAYINPASDVTISGLESFFNVLNLLFAKRVKFFFCNFCGIGAFSGLYK